MLNIKEAREINHLSQEACAKQLSISRSSYNKYENGVHNPSIETLVNMSGLFGVSVDFLLGVSNMQISADDLYCLITNSSVDDASALSCPSVNVPCSFAFRLRRARVGAGLSQETLSKKLSIPVDEYVLYESGKKLPHKSLLDSIVSELKVSAPWLQCNIEYIDSHTGSHFDPGEFRGLVDASLDPIEIKDDLLSSSLNISPEMAHFANLMNNLQQNDRSNFIKLIELWLKLDSFDQGTILGEAKQMLCSSKYSPNYSHPKNQAI